MNRVDTFIWGLLIGFLLGGVTVYALTGFIGLT